MAVSDKQRIDDWDVLAEANLGALMAMLPGAEVADTPRALRVATSIPHSFCNPVFLRNLPTGDALAAFIVKSLCVKPIKAVRAA